MQPELTTSRSVALYTVAMTISGSIGVAATESGLSPVDVVLARCAIGALVLVGYCACTRGFRGVRYSVRTFGLTVAGGLCIVANWVLFFTAFSLTSITIATVVYQVQPFVLALLAQLVLRERVAADRLRWMAVAFGGVVAVTGIGRVTLDHALGVGVGLAIGAAVLYSVASLIARQLRAIPPQVTLAVQLTVGALAIAPWASAHALAPSRHALPYLVVLGAVHTGLLYALVYRALQRLPVATISVLSFVYPAVAVLCDALVYGHRPGKIEIAGIILILGANLGAARGWKLGASGGAGRGEALRTQA
jgi:drug/metabolite transporter (DMT)-like permease